MKNTIYIKTALIQIFLIIITLIGLSTCSNIQKSEHTEAVTVEFHEIKFENSNQENDAKFLINAAEICLEEIDISQLAQRKGRITDVRELGNMIEHSHNKTFNDLTELAKKKLISVPMTVTDTEQNSYKMLSVKSGINFDKAYCEMIINKHKEAIRIFEKASTEAFDEDIKVWANETLSSLRVNFNHAISCQMKCERM